MVMFVGTSLTAGLGVEPEEAYPALIRQKIDSAGLNYRVVNAGVSGETSAGALRRIDWLLREPVAVLVLETGANDGLRGQDPDSIRATIQAIIDRVHAAQPATRILLVGMNAMPNLGREYVTRFQAIYPAVARANGLPIVPALLEGVGGVDSLNQPDGIHPTPAGHRRLAANVWQVLQPLLTPSS
jgi:acyl-CoA thioesterase-1